MPGTRTEEILKAGFHDPRYVYNFVMRQVAWQRLRISVPPRLRRLRVDWAVSLENGYVPQNQFPAKYQFGVGAES